jgi:HK97 family phage major capsid protein
MNESQTKRTLQLRSDAREEVHAKQEQLLRELDGATPNDTQAELLRKYRSDLQYFDEEIDAWSDQVDADEKARQKSEQIRRASQAARGADVEFEGEGIVYRSMSAYARDILITHGDRHVRAQVDANVSKDDIKRAGERLESLERLPATTLTSDLAGLNPPQHIAQIFQVINDSRPLVDAAGVKANLNKGTVTYPQVDATPVVAVQGTQKTEAGNTGMDISMITATASTYLGGGNLSWQAIEWSDPNAFDLWFREAAAHYAYMTEVDAATVVSADAFLNNIASPIATSADFAAFMAGVGAGYSEVYANSGRIANTILLAPDRFGYLLGMTSAAFSQFVDVGQNGIGPLRVIVSRGLNAGEVIVGDMNGLLVAETAGAPVRMFVSEPAIAGVEVGLVGAFEAAVVDSGAFAAVSTAS